MPGKKGWCTSTSGEGGRWRPDEYRGAAATREGVRRREPPSGGGSEAEGTGGQGPETAPSETRAPETRAPETRAPETRAPETRAQGGRGRQRGRWQRATGRDAPAARSEPTP